MAERTCQIDEQTTFAEFPSLWTPGAALAAPPPRPGMGRREFLKRTAITTAALTAADFLRYFLNFGIPRDSRAYATSARKSEEGGEPHFLIYWFLLMRAGLSCAFWIESRDIRKFDSHRNREGLWEKDGRTPRGQTDQTAWMKEDLWEPLVTLVDLLKTTPYKSTGKSLWDFTTIVLTSEFGRTIHGDVDAIRMMSIPDADKQKQIDGQDICQHRKT